MNSVVIVIEEAGDRLTCHYGPAVRRSTWTAKAGQGPASMDVAMAEPVTFNALNLSDVFKILAKLLEETSDA